MTTIFYKDLIGKHVKINLRRYKKTDEFEGIIIWEEGCWLGLKQDNGETICLPKLGKRDNMTYVDENEKERISS